jgi:thymidylate synthase
MTNKNTMRYQINKDALPDKFPTYEHKAAFWESLGRAVATFGFLEEVLSKAIFSFTATQPYSEDEIQEAYEKWPSRLEHALKDSLGRLINDYGKAVRDHPDATFENLDKLLTDLKKASEIRNVLCHASWNRKPDATGASVPFFVNQKMEIFNAAMDCQYIDQVQRHAADLACSVINTVTHMGWQFPGSNGPGKAIWDNTTSE